jgi:hypothetical protein
MAKAPSLPMKCCNDSNLPLISMEGMPPNCFAVIERGKGGDQGALMAPAHGRLSHNRNLAVIVPFL